MIPIRRLEGFLSGQSAIETAERQPCRTCVVKHHILAMGSLKKSGKNKKYQGIQTLARGALNISLNGFQTEEKIDMMNTEDVSDVRTEAKTIVDILKFAALSDEGKKMWKTRVTPYLQYTLENLKSRKFLDFLISHPHFCETPSENRKTLQMLQKERNLECPMFNFIHTGSISQQVKANLQDKSILPCAGWEAPPDVHPGPRAGLPPGLPGHADR